MGERINTGVDTNGIPMYLIKEFIKEIDIDVLIECGSAGGESIKVAASYFKECHTVEIVETRKLNDLSSNTIQHIGNSIDVLPEIIDDLIKYKEENVAEEEYRYALFFLDSHFDGDKPKDSHYKDCYLLEELDIISGYSQDSVIIIDDARLFMGYPPHPNNPKEWPTIQHIFAKFQDKFKYFFVSVIDDYIIAIPDRLEWIFQKEWMARYKIRYPDESEKIKNATRLAYDSLLKYIQ